MSNTETPGPSASQPDLASQGTMLSEVECNRLRKYIARRARNSADIDDIFQETLFLLIKAESKSPIENLLAYCFRVADSVMIKEARRSVFKGEFPDTDIMEERPGPEQEVDYQQRMAAFKSALQKMGSLRRDVFVKRHLGDLSREDIARELGISLESVKKHLVRARHELAGVSMDLGFASRTTPNSNKGREQK